MSQVFSNNATTTLAVALGMSDTLVTVATGDGAKFQAPTGGDYELITFHDKNYTKWEVVKCTARTGDVLTVTRGEEGTQQTWNLGEFVSANITAGTLSSILSRLAALEP